MGASVCILSENRKRDLSKRKTSSVQPTHSSQFSAKDVREADSGETSTVLRNGSQRGKVATDCISTGTSTVTVSRNRNMMSTFHGEYPENKQDLLTVPEQMETSNIDTIPKQEVANNLQYRAVLLEPVGRRGNSPQSYVATDYDSKRKKNTELNTRGSASYCQSEMANRQSSSQTAEDALERSLTCRWIDLHQKESCDKTDTSEDSQYFSASCMESYSRREKSISRTSLSSWSSQTTISRLGSLILADLDSIDDNYGGAFTSRSNLARPKAAVASRRQQIAAAPLN